MGWITRLLEGADAQRSTTPLGREDAKAEAEPQAASDDSALGFWVPAVREREVDREAGQ